MPENTEEKHCDTDATTSEYDPYCFDADKDSSHCVKKSESPVFKKSADNSSHPPSQGQKDSLQSVLDDILPGSRIPVKKKKQPLLPIRPEDNLALAVAGYKPPQPNGPSDPRRKNQKMKTIKQRSDSGQSDGTTGNPIQMVQKMIRGLDHIDPKQCALNAAAEAAISASKQEIEFAKSKRKLNVDDKKQGFLDAQGHDFSKRYKQDGMLSDSDLSTKLPQPKLPHVPLDSMEELTAEDIEGICDNMDSLDTSTLPVVNDSNNVPEPIIDAFFDDSSEEMISNTLDSVLCESPKEELLEEHTEKTGGNSVVKNMEQAVITEENIQDEPLEKNLVETEKKNIDGTIVESSKLPNLETSTINSTSPTVIPTKDVLVSDTGNDEKETTNETMETVTKIRDDEEKNTDTESGNTRDIKDEKEVFKVQENSLIQESKPAYCEQEIKAKISTVQDKPIEPYASEDTGNKECTAKECTEKECTEKECTEKEIVEKEIAEKEIVEKGIAEKVIIEKESPKCSEYVKPPKQSEQLGQEKKENVELEQTDVSAVKATNLKIEKSPVISSLESSMENTKTPVMFEVKSINKKELDTKMLDKSDAKSITVDNTTENLSKELVSEESIEKMPSKKIKTPKETLVTTEVTKHNKSPEEPKLKINTKKPVLSTPDSIFATKEKISTLVPKIATTPGKLQKESNKIIAKTITSPQRLPSAKNQTKSIDNILDMKMKSIEEQTHNHIKTPTLINKVSTPAKEQSQKIESSSITSLPSDKQENTDESKKMMVSDKTTPGKMQFTETGLKIPTDKTSKNPEQKVKTNDLENCVTEQSSVKKKSTNDVVKKLSPNHEKTPARESKETPVGKNILPKEHMEPNTSNEPVKTEVTKVTPESKKQSKRRTPSSDSKKSVKRQTKTPPVKSKEDRKPTERTQIEDVKKAHPVLADKLQSNPLIEPSEHIDNQSDPQHMVQLVNAYDVSTLGGAAGQEAILMSDQMVDPAAMLAATGMFDPAAIAELTSEQQMAYAQQMMLTQHMQLGLLPNHIYAGLTDLQTMNPDLSAEQMQLQLMQIYGGTVPLPTETSPASTSKSPGGATKKRRRSRAKKSTTPPTVADMLQVPSGGQGTHPVMMLPHAQLMLNPALGELYCFVVNHKYLRLLL